MINFYVDHLEDGTGFKFAPINGEDLWEILERLTISHGFPAFLRMDDGPELTYRTLA